MRIENVDIGECLEPQTPVLHDVCTVMHLVHQGDEGGRHLAGTHGAHVLYHNTPVTPLAQTDKNCVSAKHLLSLVIAGCSQ